MVPADRHRGERILLHPGEYRVSREPVTLATLLGSCVAVCMYDPVQRVMGMNHFLLAVQRSAGGSPMLTSEQGRYGVHAMELLINGLLKCGAQRQNLKAKAFGGGNVLGARCDETPGHLRLIPMIEPLGVLVHVDFQRNGAQFVRRAA